MPIEELYIGVKLIKAYPAPAPEGVRGNNKPGDPGYSVRYDNNYTAWSPKDVFEKAYRRVSQDEIDFVAGNIPKPECVKDSAR